MSRYKVLVDSSVWIRYFRSGDVPLLDRLLEEELVCTNELILTELLPVLRHRKSEGVSEGLAALEKVPLKISWEVVREYQELNLQNGLNQVGVPDLIIVQQVI